MRTPLTHFLSRILPLALLGTLAVPGWASECPAPAPPGTAGAPTDDDASVSIESDGAEITRSGDAKLLGEVVVRQGSRTLTAEDATYDAATQSFKVDGSVSYRDPNVRVRGESGTWNGERGGRFTETEFELPARPARGSARELVLTPQGDLELQQVTFTTCPAGNDDWQLRAASIVIDREREQGSGRKVRLDFKGVPLLYLPYISFPAGVGRKSGFLFPSIGTSSSSGFEFTLPYYLNLAPNYDATIEPTVLGRRGVALGGNLRVLTERSRGRLEGRFLPSDQVAGRDRSYARLQETTDFSEWLRLSGSLEHASDGLYFEDFGRGIDGTSITHLERRVLLEYLGNGWRVEGLLQNYQTIDQEIGDLEEPYARVPQLMFQGAWPLAGSRVTAGLGGEAVHFMRDTGIVGTRLDLEPRLAWSLRAPGYFLEPSLSFRHTRYQLGETEPGQNRSPSRSAPTGVLDAGLVFERSTGSRGKLLQTVEPRVLYTWVPYRDQDDLPVFDSGLPELDMVRLFSPNRYVGADRLADANQLAIGMTTRLLDADSGRQYLAATIGQQIFFERSRISLPDEPADTRDSSDLVAELELTAYQNWSVDLGMQWDPDHSNTVLGQATLQYRPRPDSVVNVGYRYREGRIEQWQSSAAWAVHRNWNLYARHVYSLRDRRAIDSFAGLEYESCCWRLRLLARRHVSSRTGQRDTTIDLQLELKGLSSVGTTSSAFLERSIRGYSRGRAAGP